MHPQITHITAKSLRFSHVRFERIREKTTHVGLAVEFAMILHVVQIGNIEMLVTLFRHFVYHLGLQRVGRLVFLSVPFLSLQLFVIHFRFLIKDLLIYYQPLIYEAK